MPSSCARWLIPLGLASVLNGQPTPSADEVMAKAAANIERSAEARKRYVYEQALRMKLIGADQKIARQEQREYEVFPSATSTRKTLVRLTGSYRQGSSMVPYAKAGFRHGSLDLDGEIMDSMIESLVDDEKERDGVDLDLFPLRSAQIPYYRFVLRDNSEISGRAVYRIEFQPDLKKCRSANAYCPVWKGEALIDREDLFPVRMDTHLARGIPWWVRTTLGTNVRQAGFSIRYTRLSDGVWFPASYGTEFRLKAIWFYQRTIALSLDNRRFRKTSADSTIVFEPGP